MPIYIVIHSIIPKDNNYHATEVQCNSAWVAAKEVRSKFDSPIEIYYIFEASRSVSE